jgi:hypothetical protein
LDEIKAAVTNYQKKLKAAVEEIEKEKTEIAPMAAKLS